MCDGCQERCELDGDVVTEELFPMQVTLWVNGRFVLRGSLQDARDSVASYITSALEKDAEGFALDAQTANMAFNSGAVRQQLDERGEWYMVMGAQSNKFGTWTVHIKREV